MQLVLVLLLIVTALGSWEMFRHARHRGRIPIRVHVNGSRGKSSVARLIAAGFKAGGIAVVGKTTGSAAAVINTDGSETPVVRRGGPNIKEQLGVFRRAARQKPQALVIECMAVRPDLQKVCEHNIVKATHGVITNVRPDHLEVMGPTMDDVAVSLAGTVPNRSHLFTAEDRYHEFLESRARKSRSGFTLSLPEAVSETEMKRFAYEEFPENVSLALDVCKSVGVDRQIALEGMWQVTPDVGAMTRWAYVEDVGGEKRQVEFINGFAANDPDSYVRVWDRLGLNEQVENVILLMNIRGDRQRRSKDLAPLFGREMKAAHYVLVGEDTALFGDILRRGGRVPPVSIHDLSSLNAADLWTRLVSMGGDNTSIIGVGNIANIGNRLLAHLRQRETAV